MVPPRVWLGGDVCVSMRVDRDFSDAAKLVENDTAFFFFETN